jgi:hypothetical protein
MRTDGSFLGGQSTGGFPLDFFAAVNRHDEFEAVASVRRVALQPDGQPSPRVEELGGEWDSTGVGLCLLAEGCCAGAVGTGEDRFCGKPQGTCTTGTHKKATKTVVPGWYIAAGGRHSGFLWAPSLPTALAGGPMRAGGAAFMAETTNPFRMSRGQWTLVIEEWLVWNAARQPRGSPAGDAASTPSTLGMRDATATAAAARVVPAPVNTDFGGVRFAADPLGAALGVGEEDNDQFGLWTAAPPAPQVDDDDDPFSFFAEPAARPVREVAPAARAAVSTARTGARGGGGPVGDEDWVQQKLDACAREAADSRRLAEETVEEMGRLKSGVQRLVQAMDGQMDEHKERVRLLETEARDLRQRLDGLETKAQDFEAAGWVRQVERCIDGVFAPLGIVSMLTLQIRNFKDRIESGGGLECNGVRFASMRDALVWYETKNIDSPGLFVDALALLHGGTGAYVSMTESGKRRETQGKNRYVGDVEEFVIQSFDTTIPSSFVGGKQEIDGASAHAVLKGVLKDFQVWKPRGELFTGLSTQITEGVRKRSAQMKAFRDESTSDPEVRELSAGLMADSVVFCQELVSFINTQNDSLTHDTTYSAEQIWDMQLECIRTIFQELADARSEFMLPAKLVPGYYLWGMLRAWEIQQRYLRNHFKDDGALMGIFVRRVVLQSGTDGIKDRLVKLDKLESQVIDNNRTHTQAIKALQTAVARLKP